MNNILDCEYIDTLEKWELQKKLLYERYNKKYKDKKIKIRRVKTDTQGLRCYVVEEIK